MSRIVVGMSGGVDSSLTAALLHEQGHEVLGVYMQNWSDDTHLHGCSSWEEDRQDALKIATKLGIPFRAVSFQQEYSDRVVDYMTAEYQSGRTPNPDILCNREIKFGMLLEWALKHGYEYLATGHYARVEHEVEGSRLLRGVDRSKDQSYFLSQLSPVQLQHALFPLGEMLKKEVRAAAAKRGLAVANKPDSQGLCFVGKVNVTEFLKERLLVTVGEVVGTDGAVLGEHQGAALFTVGQRRGVGVSGAVPLYVLRTELDTNRVVVGYDRDLYHADITTEPAHQVSPDFITDGEYAVSIRYRMQPEPAEVTACEDGLQIRFLEAQRGPTPGQFAVLYRGEELVGSAVIR